MTTQADRQHEQAQGGEVRCWGTPCCRCSALCSLSALCIPSLGHPSSVKMQARCPCTSSLSLRLLCCLTGADCKPAGVLSSGAGSASRSHAPQRPPLGPTGSSLRRVPPACLPACRRASPRRAVPRRATTPPAYSACSGSGLSRACSIRWSSVCSVTQCALCRTRPSRRCWRATSRMSARSSARFSRSALAASCERKGKWRGRGDGEQGGDTGNVQAWHLLSEPRSCAEVAHATGG